MSLMCIGAVPIQIIGPNESNSKCKNRTKIRKRVSTIIMDQNDPFQIYLISSRKDREKWKLPGGGIEEGESITQTAIRETLEEAGVSGRVDNYLGDYENKIKKTLTYTVTFISTKIHDTWEENSRNRGWFNIYKAYEKLEGEDREMLFDYICALVI